MTALPRAAPSGNLHQRLHAAECRPVGWVGNWALPSYLVYGSATCLRVSCTCVLCVPRVPVLHVCNVYPCVTCTRLPRAPGCHVYRSNHLPRAALFAPVFRGNTKLRAVDTVFNVARAVSVARRVRGSGSCPPHLLQCSDGPFTAGQVKSDDRFPAAARSWSVQEYSGT